MDQTFISLDKVSQFEQHSPFLFDQVKTLVSILLNAEYVIVRQS